MTQGMSAFPDIEAAIMLAMRTADSTPFGTNVHPSIPASATYPLLRVQRLGGPAAVRERLDAARIQLDAYGDNKGDAFDSIERARQIMFEIEGTTLDTFSCFVTGVTMEVGATWLPDTVTGRDRYTASFVVYAHTAG